MAVSSTLGAGAESLCPAGRHRLKKPGGYCNPCATKAWRDARKQEDPEAWRRYKAAANRESYARLRKQVIDGLGGCCACCGESNPHFLEVDHILGDGGKHRRKRANNSYKVMKDILSEGCPTNRYQVLCANCHHAKTNYDPLHLCH